MNNEKYFENLPKVGDLYLEKVFVKFEDENILFICHNRRNEKFLCVCYEIRGVLKWVLCKTTCNAILKLLCGVLSVRDCFDNSEESLILVQYTEKNGEKSCRKNLKDIESRILPDADFCLKYDMNSDSYYVGIYNELFKKNESLISTAKMEFKEDILEDGKNRILLHCVPKKEEFIHKKEFHLSTNKNVAHDILNVCA